MSDGKRTYHEPRYTYSPPVYGSVRVVNGVTFTHYTSKP